MNPERLNVEVDTSASPVVVSLSGELDIVSASDLQTRLEQIVSDANGRVRLDLSGLTFIDSTGLSSFIAAHRSAEENGVTLEFAGVSAQTRRLMDVTKLSELFVFAEE